MQENKEQIFKKAVGEVIKDVRITSKNLSINKFANEYDFDKGNLSKIEKGVYSIYLITAWKLAEALGLNFVEFAQKLKDKLGDDFKFLDE